MPSTTTLTVPMDVDDFDNQLHARLRHKSPTPTANLSSLEKKALVSIRTLELSLEAERRSFLAHRVSRVSDEIKGKSLG